MRFREFWLQKCFKTLTPVLPWLQCLALSSPSLGQMCPPANDTAVEICNILLMFLLSVNSLCRWVALSPVPVLSYTTNTVYCANKSCWSCYCRQAMMAIKLIWVVAEAPLRHTPPLPPSSTALGARTDNSLDVAAHSLAKQMLNDCTSRQLLSRLLQSSK